MWTRLSSRLWRNHVNKPRKRRVVKKVKQDGPFSNKLLTLARNTVAKVKAGTMTRDAAQKLLTESGMPVLKIEGWVDPHAPHA